MADDRNLHHQQQPMRIIHEYDFFADNKYKTTHILPLPENPEALRQFFVPELVPPPRVFRRHKTTGKNRRRHEIPQTATSIRIFGVDINVDQQTATTSINKAGKEKILQSSSNIQDKNTRLMGNTEGIITATNLGNVPSVDHQEIRDFLKLQVGRSNLVLHDDQETARSINKGKEKTPPMGDSTNTKIMGNTKGITINEDKNTARNPTTNFENPSEAHHHNHQYDQEPNPPLFHQKILKEIHNPPVFLFDKELEMSDLYSGPNQLRILDATNVIRFMNREERSKVHKGGFVSVITREAQGAVKEHVLQLAKLEGRPYDIVLVLRDGWLSVLADLRLKLGDFVQGWGYRKDGEFRLALNIIRVPYPKS